MPSITFEESIELKEVSKDVFENVHEPWTWPNSSVVPGGVLMTGCAKASYHTVPEDFVLDSLQCHFLGGLKSAVPMIFRVTNLSNGRRFAVRSVTIEQEGKVVLHATVSFMNASPWTGPAMTHSRGRKTIRMIEKISIDDLERGSGRQGPFMKFQRLPLTFRDSQNRPEYGLTTSAAQISPPLLAKPGSKTHLFGILNLSDYHVMDTPIQLNGITFGLAAIGDTSRTPTEDNVKVGTSLNHSIHFHIHEGFRADELTYIEVEVLWARDGRAMLCSSIFSKEGLLIATCSQEAFYVLKIAPPVRNNGKL